MILMDVALDSGPQRFIDLIKILADFRSLKRKMKTSL